MPALAELVSGVVRGKKALNKAIVEAKQAAARRVVDFMYDWAATFFPRKTGYLLSTFEVLPLQNKILLKVGAHYASFVNKMTGVNWTNPLTVEHFFTEAVKIAKRMYAEFFFEEMRNAGLDVRRG